MMSLFGADFLRNMDEHCSEVSPLDLEYQPDGFLFLTDDAPAAKKNSEMQKKIGARNILLPCDEMQKKIPFLNLPGVELGCLGLESEGSFNPLALQENLRRKSINLGAEFVHGKIVGFEFKLQPNIIAPNNGQAYEQLERVVMKLPNNEIHAIKFGFCIIADDQNSKNIAEFARIGKGDGLLSIPLDTDCLNRKTLCYESPELFGLSVPTVVTPNGTTFRVDGLLGQLFVSSEENEDVQQQISKFLNFKNLKLKQTFEESYESNVLDGCGVIGPHPFYHNLLIAAGFSQHGAQHAPAVGRALMELIIDGEYKTIDLSRFGFDRLCLEEPIEGNWSLVHRQNNYY